MQNPSTFPEKNTSFLLPGPAGQLEVMTALPDSIPLNGVGIICHPDPRFDGSMHNKVVTTIARALMDLGLATVRFNFRGVGLSSGEYGETRGELADLNAVITWVRSVLPTSPLWLAGFSFGSYISALAAQTARPARLISVAPGVNRHPFQQFTHHYSYPWLVVQGDQDEVVPCAQVQDWIAHLTQPPQLIVMPGASHFFHGQLIELREIIKKWALS